MGFPPVPGLPTFAVGTAAEHLVCADLLRLGHQAVLAPPGCVYDVIAGVGALLLRLQVKGAGYPRAATGAYSFNVDTPKRNTTSAARRSGSKPYADDSFDLLACVALDIGAVAYLNPTTCSPWRVSFRVPGGEHGVGGRPANNFEDHPFDATVAALVEWRRLCASGVPNAQSL